jgi:hypothetical protein
MRVNAAVDERDSYARAAKAEIPGVRGVHGGRGIIHVGNYRAVRRDVCHFLITLELRESRSGNSCMYPLNQMQVLDNAAATSCYGLFMNSARLMFVLNDYTDLFIGLPTLQVRRNLAPRRKKNGWRANDQS